MSETLEARLKWFGSTNTGDVSATCREAAAELSRLRAEVATKDEMIAGVSRLARHHQARADAAAQALAQAREIVGECADDFHVCKQCGHQDDAATRESNLYLLLVDTLPSPQGTGHIEPVNASKDGGAK